MSRMGNNVSRYIDAVSLLVKAPRTAVELCELVGMSRCPVDRLLAAMHSERLIEPFGEIPQAKFGGKVPGTIVWMWSAR